MKNTKTYVVDLHQQDKEVSITTKEFGQYYVYTIKPEY